MYIHTCLLSSDLWCCYTLHFSTYIKLRMSYVNFMRTFFIHCQLYENALNALLEDIFSKDFLPFLQDLYRLYVLHTLYSGSAFEMLLYCCLHFNESKLILILQDLCSFWSMYSEKQNLGPNYGRGPHRDVASSSESVYTCAICVCPQVWQFVVAHQDLILDWCFPSQRETNNYH